MSRLIKFRVWDGKEMHAIQDYPHLVIEEKGRWFVFHHKMLTCNYIDGQLMQFTGLRDRNYKEIYEGDVVKYPSGFQHVVEYNEGADASGALYIGFSFATPSERYCEVIGNIYENPELLDK